MRGIPLKWSDLRTTCKRESDYIITLFVTNEISLLLTFLLAKTRVTPNQVTLLSLLCGLLCGVCYALGWFFTGSIFLFLSHILDCTDGNLARVKALFSPLGRWLDFMGDRLAEIFIFLGVSIYFSRTAASGFWVMLPVLDALFLLFYYYIVDISLALGISKPKQDITAVTFKSVHVKWGLLEPVLYGFIILAPLGAVKFQTMAVLFLVLAGLAYQAVKNIAGFKN